MKCTVLYRYVLTDIQIINIIKCRNNIKKFYQIQILLRLTEGFAEMQSLGSGAKI